MLCDDGTIRRKKADQRWPSETNYLSRPEGLKAFPKSESPARGCGAWRSREGCRGLGAATPLVRQCGCATSVPKDERSAERSRHRSALAPHSAFPRSPPVIETSCEKMVKSRQPDEIKTAISSLLGCVS
jgi:hypothetical protein